MTFFRSGFQYFDALIVELDRVFQYVVNISKLTVALKRKSKNR